MGSEKRRDNRIEQAQDAGCLLGQSLIRRLTQATNAEELTYQINIIEVAATFVLAALTASDVAHAGASVTKELARHERNIQNYLMQFLDDIKTGKAVEFKINIKGAK